MDIFTSLDNKDFTSFSKAVEKSIEDKVRNNPTMKKYEDEYTKVQDIKNMFAKINNEYSNSEGE